MEVLSYPGHFWPSGLKLLEKKRPARLLKLNSSRQYGVVLLSVLNVNEYLCEDIDLHCILTEAGAVRDKTGGQGSTPHIPSPNINVTTSNPQKTKTFNFSSSKMLLYKSLK